jgi:hypothetical protein
MSWENTVSEQNNVEGKSSTSGLCNNLFLIFLSGLERKNAKSV